ncbi:MAG: hypothetical protein IANPNBLG_03011 [Bryobacteraceae bacterium]|nr:hypothetical protein [Bryobacteraceae bacterium]
MKILIAAAFWAGMLLQAQGPPAPKNLQVLPKDISHDDLMKAMRAASQGLGVQCSFCHVPREMDKDDKHEKIVARHMFTMVMNLRKTEGMPEEVASKITCWTCHRGSAHIELPPPPAPPAKKQ